MIIKSLSRKSNTSQLLKYIFRYMLDPKKQIAHGINEVKKDSPVFMIRHNIRSRSSITNLIKEFEENELYRLVRRKDSVKLYHTVLSFSNKDSHLIDDRMLKDIAKKFISERGLGNLYVGTKHEDKSHIHLHIAISGVQTNGRSSRVSKQQFHHIKLEMDRYQKENYPDLIHSLPEHGRAKKEQTKETILERIKQSRQTKKKDLCQILEDVYQKSVSKEDFISQLTKNGHEVYYRNGRLQGIVFEGRKFRFNRIGFDDPTIQALDQKSYFENNALLELDALRKGAMRETEKEQEGNLEKQNSSTKTELTEEEKELKELFLLRSEIEQEREIGFNQPSLFDELGSQTSMISEIAEAPALLSLPFPKSIIPIDILPD